LQVKLNARRFLVHRVIWAIVNGRWPHTQIDHINGITNDNRLCNLREATPVEHGQNMRGNRRSTSGFPGVWWNKRNRKWVASIKVRGHRYYLGLFDSAETAFKVRCDAKAFYHPFQPFHRGMTGQQTDLHCEAALARQWRQFTANGGLLDPTRPRFR
jgi:hypothetical protein